MPAPQGWHPVPPSPPTRRSWFAGGWGSAVLWAAITFGGLMAFSIGMAFVLNAVASDGGTAPAAALLRLGAGLFYLYNRVGQTVSVSGIPADLTQNVGGLTAAKGTIAFAALGGTGLVLWLMALGGRAIGREVGGAPVWRGLNGVKVAIPYTVLCFLGALAARWSTTAPVGSATLHVVVHPSYIAAIGWTLALGLVAGFAGAYRTGDRTQASRVEGMLWNGARTGWTMMLLSLAGAFAGLLVMSVLKPHDTAGYFHGAFSSGFAAGILAIVLTLLFVPNMSALIVFPSMGSCVSASVSAQGGGVSACLLSWAHFPAATASSATSGLAGGTFPSLPAPSAPYYLFILAPLVAVLVGGRLAAARAGAATKRDAVAAGALAGVGYAVIAAFVAVMSALVVKVTGNASALSSGASVSVGPDPFLGCFVALLWGVAGGTLGALYFARAMPGSAPPEAITTATWAPADAGMGTPPVMPPPPQPPVPQPPPMTPAAVDPRAPDPLHGDVPVDPPG